MPDTLILLDIDLNAKQDRQSALFANLIRNSDIVDLNVNPDILEKFPDAAVRGVLLFPCKEMENKIRVYRDKGLPVAAVLPNTLQGQIESAKLGLATIQIVFDTAGICKLAGPATMLLNFNEEFNALQLAQVFDRVGVRLAAKPNYPLLAEVLS